MIGKLHLCALLLVTAAAGRAFADDTDLDVRSFEYVDVIETTDGSVWKGVVIEETPSVQYKVATADGSLHVIKAADIAKISKQKNREWRGGSSTSTTTSTTPGGVNGSFQSGGSALPAPYAHSGVRVDVGGITAIPAGDIDKLDTSFSPNLQVGYEALFGNLGLSAGGLARFTYWRLPQGEDPQDAAWTLETHAYARAALHVARVAFYGGGSIGLDTNMVHIGMLNMSKSAEGLGMNLQAGAEVAATDKVAVALRFDYHPGTDTILDGAPQSISYFALGLGAALRM